MAERQGKPARYAVSDPPPMPVRAERPAQSGGLVRPTSTLFRGLPRGFRSSSSDSDSPSSATAMGTAFRGCEGSGESCVQDPEGEKEG